MIEVWKRSELDKLIRRHGLRLSKAYGQNFLTDRNILEKIVQSAEISADDHVIEIGAGVGTLTILLAQAAGYVTAVEIDGRLMPALRESTVGLQNIELVNEDFLKYDTAKAQDRTQSEFKLVGNLPYNIASPLIAGLFEPKKKPITRETQGDKTQEDIAENTHPTPPALAVFMIQKEVAERLVSPPGKKAYGAISVLVQYYAEAELLFEVSREVFLPKPNVDSAVIRLKPRDLSSDDPAVASRMFRLVRSGFDMRRKTLRNSFAHAGFSADALLTAFGKSGIDSGRRAETLSPREFYEFASFL